MNSKNRTLLYLLICNIPYSSTKPMPQLHKKSILLTAFLCFTSMISFSQNTGYFGKKNLIGIQTFMWYNNDFLGRETEFFKYNKNTSKIVMKYGLTYERILTKKVNLILTSYLGKSKNELIKIYNFSNYQQPTYYGFATSRFTPSYIEYAQKGATLGFKIFKKGSFTPIGSYLFLGIGAQQNKVEIVSNKIYSAEENLTFQDGNDFNKFKFENTIVGSTLGIGTQFLANDHLSIDYGVNFSLGFNIEKFTDNNNYSYSNYDIKMDASTAIGQQNFVQFYIALKFVR